MRYRLLTLPALALTFAACLPDNNAPTTPSAEAKYTLQLAGPNTVTVAQDASSAGPVVALVDATNGDTVQYGTNSRYFDISSSDTKIATITWDDMGFPHVKGVRPGTATLTATYFDVTSQANLPDKTIQVTVTPSAATSVTLTPGDTTLYYVSASDFDTQAFKATVKNGTSTISGRAVDYTSTNAAVATVSSSGVVTTKGVGTTSIIASTNNATGATIADTTVITVQGTRPVVRVTVSPASATLKPGNVLPLKVTAYAGNGAVLTGRTLLCTSSNPTMVQVDATTCTVTAGTPPTAAAEFGVVTATIEGQSAMSNITVQK